MLSIHKNSKGSSSTSQKEKLSPEDIEPQEKAKSKNDGQRAAAVTQKDSTVSKNAKDLAKFGEKSEKDRANKENIQPMGILGGRKRMNRGYNPKYDSKETEFVCKGDLQAQQAQPQASTLQSQSKRLKCEGQAVPVGGSTSVKGVHSDVENHK